MRHLPVALILTATFLAGCQPMSMPPVEELSPPPTGFGAGDPAAWWGGYGRFHRSRTAAAISHR